MAKQILAANGLTGGTSGKLDDILHTLLEDGNIAIVINASDSTTYFYKYDSSSSASESSPDVIQPDSNSGNGRWLLTSMTCDDATIKGAMTIAETLGVTGASTLASLGVTNNATVGGTLDVTGAATAASLELGGAGAVPTEFSTDGTLGDNSDTAVPTEKAVKTYVDAQPNPNVIQNASFQIAQRGTGFSAITSSQYTLDRWRYGTSSLTATVAQQNFSIGDNYVDGEPPRYIEVIQTDSGSAASDVGLLQQRIENVYPYSDKTYTVTFWAKADASRDLAVGYTRYYGSGGSASDSGHVEKFTLTTSWAKYSATITFSDVSGNSVGTGHYLALSFYFTAGSDYNTETDTLGFQTGTFSISNVKFERGSRYTSFVPKSYNEDLLDCLRYYQKNDNGPSSYSAMPSTVLSDNYYFGQQFQIPMRTTSPTITITDVAETGSGFNGITTGDITVAITSDYGFRWLASATTSSTSPSSVGIEWTASCDL